MVFGEMSPEYKKILIQELKKENIKALMCGDGANDLPAIRVAHLGILLCEEKITLGAPFTSNVQDVSCVIDLLKEGKCSLSTCITMCKYTMIYGNIQLIAIFLSLIYCTEPTDFQYVFIDLLILFPTEYFMGLLSPGKELSHHSPSENIFSLPILFDVTIHTILVFGFQFGGYKIIHHLCSEFF